MVLPCPMPDVFGIGWVWVGKGNSVLALGLGTMLGHSQRGVTAFGCAKGTAGGTGCKMG